MIGTGGEIEEKKKKELLMVGKTKNELKGN